MRQSLWPAAGEKKIPVISSSLVVGTFFSFLLLPFSFSSPLLLLLLSPSSSPPPSSHPFFFSFFSPFFPPSPLLFSPPVGSSFSPPAPPFLPSFSPPGPPQAKERGRGVRGEDPPRYKQAKSLLEPRRGGSMYPRKKPACAFAIGANIRMATVLRFLANLLLFLSSSSPIAFKGAVG